MDGKEKKYMGKGRRDMVSKEGRGCKEGGRGGKEEERYYGEKKGTERGRERTGRRHMCGCARACVTCLLRFFLSSRVFAITH